MILSAIALACAAIPALLIAGNLRLFRTPAPSTNPPSISVLIPARDEASNIGEACAAVLANQDAELELIVLDDGSTDATASIVRGLGDPRLRLVTAPPLPPGWSGKQHACACLGGLARYELLVFIDADVRLAPDALLRIAGFMQGARVGMGSGFPAEITRSWAEALLLPLIHFMLLGFLPLWLARRDPRPAFGAGCGQMIAAWKASYERVGGHGVVPATLHDGITLPRAFRRAGDMTGVFDASRFARCRMYGNAREVFGGLARNATEGMAQPLALPVWTLLLGFGQVLVWPLAVFAPGWLSCSALILATGPRLILAWRFHQPIWSALAHPLGIAALIGIQWWALLRRAFGISSTWRGRSYVNGRVPRHARESGHTGHPDQVA